MFPDGSTSPDEQQSSAPSTDDLRIRLRQMLDKTAAKTQELEKLKSQPAPTLAESTTDENVPSANDALRGFFQSSMPQQSQQDNFGQQFRDSISPGREFLANVMNGLSAGFGGTKFKSVRDQAYDRFVTEQKLQQERDDLRQRTMQGVAQIAQQVHTERQKEAAARTIALYKGAQSEEQRQIKLNEIQQRIQGGDVQLLNLLQKDAAQRQAAADKPQYSDKFYHAAELQTKAQYEAAGLDTKDKKYASSYQKDIDTLAHRLRLQDLQDQAANKPKEPKTATPQLVYTQNPATGGFTVQEVHAGSEIPPGAMSQAGMTNLNVPTAATRTMIEKAPSVITFVDKIGPEIDSVIKKLGPTAGRWNDFLVGKVGEKDPEMTALRTNISLLETRLMNMHVGARGSTEMMEHFHKLIDISKQDPNNLKSALTEIRDYAMSVGKEGGVSDVRKSVAEPKATHQWNPVTKRIEEIK